MYRALSRPEAHGVRRGPGAWLAAALLLVAGGVGAQAPRIGYVDMQRLLDNAPQVLDTRERLAREFAARDERLNADAQHLIDLEARQRAGTDAAGSAAALRLDAEINALRRSLERTRQRLADELRTRTREEVDLAFPRINEAVAEFAREQGYDLVLASPVVYASGRLDITDAVLDHLRRDFERSSR